MKRKPLTKFGSKKLFRKTAGNNKVHPRNNFPPMRGGYRV